MNSRLIATTLAVTAALTLAACDDDATPSATTPATAETDGTTQLPSPVFVDPATVDGTTVEVPLSNTVVITVDEVTAWSATVADPAIATFTAGGSDGSAEFNPGLSPLQVGTTTVSLTDGTTTVTFTLSVTA